MIRNQENKQQQRPHKDDAEDEGQDHIRLSLAHVPAKCDVQTEPLGIARP